MSDLDAFGLERGKVAHTASTRTRRMLDYSTEKSNIEHILEEINTFENDLG